MTEPLLTLSWRKATSFGAALGFIASIVASTVPACSLGQGDGQIVGSLTIPDCWSGCFQLQPTFFAGVPYRNSLELRIQNGGDYQTFSDGLSILVDDVTTIRPDSEGRGGHIGESLEVSLPPGVSPPGVPLKPDPNPAPVHISLYLQRTCRIQNVALYAMKDVSLDPDGRCGGVDSVATCNAPSDPTVTSGSPPIAHSRIVFSQLFNANPEEESATERLTTAKFTIYLADPREIAPGGLGPPPRCRGYLNGNFSFYFQRGRPGQPFP